MREGTVSGFGDGMPGTLRVVLPYHLRTLAGVAGEVQVRVAGEVTLGGALSALEAEHPVLRGTIRAHDGGERRPLLRFYADGIDLSHEPMTIPLPERVRRGEEPLLVVGAIAGG